MKSKVCVLARLCMLGVLTQHAYALDVDAGDYDHIPSGTNLALLYYQYANRDRLYIGHDKSMSDVSLKSDIGIARYVHYMDFNGIQIAPQILVPFGRLDAGHDIANYGSSSGIGDIILANTFFLYTDRQTKTNFALTPYLYLPTGQYDKNDALNIGENRVKVVLQAGYTRQIIDHWLWDFIVDTTLYGDNNDLAGGGKLKQDTGYQLQTALRYQITPQWDVRSSVSYLDNGNVKQNGIETKSLEQTKFTFGTAYSPTPSTQIIANYGRDLNVSNGFKESDRINLRFLYAF